MKKARRWLAVLFAVLFVFTMLSSELYIALEADHDCAGENCSVCAQIGVCHFVLKLLAGAAVAFLVVTIRLRLIMQDGLPIALNVKNTTPIKLRVKLLN